MNTSTSPTPTPGSAKACLGWLATLLSGLAASLLLVTASAALPFPAHAAPGPAAAPAEGQAFVAQFRAAASRPGAEALADITAYPFLFEGRALDRRAFAAQAVPALFKPAARRCLQQARPVAEDGRLLLSCPPYGYVLGPTPAGWRLVEFFVDTP